MAKKASVTFGVIFVLVGLLGFFSNSLVGMGSYFDANTAHSVVHLVIGLVLLYVGLKAEAKAAVTLNVVGVVYLLVAIIGFFMVTAGGTASVLGFIDVNAADNWLHLVLGVVILGLGLAAGKSSAPAQM